MVQPSAHPSLVDRRAAARGFTLTELLVVFGIIGILATMLMAGFLRMQQNARLTGMTDRVLSHLQLARSMAINHGAVYRVEIKSFVTAESQYGMWIAPAGTTSQLELMPVQKSIDVSMTPAHPNHPVDRVSVTFNPDGSSAGTIEINIVDQSTSQVRVVQVFQGGMVRLKRGN